MSGIGPVDEESCDLSICVDAEGGGKERIRHVEGSNITRGIAKKTVKRRVRVRVPPGDQSSRADTRGSGTERAWDVESSDRTRGIPKETMRAGHIVVPSGDYSTRVDARGRGT